MDSIIKIPSNQGTFDTSGNKNIVDIHLPTGLGVVNLEKSFINVNLEVNSTYTADGDAVLPAFATIDTSAQGADTGTGNSSCLVRNCSAISANKGKIEDVRRADVIRYNLSLYEKGEASRKDNLNEINGINPQTFFRNFNYAEVVKDETFASKEKSHDVRIHLKDLFGFCKTENYNTDAMGATRFNFEMNFNKLEAGSEYNNDGKYDAQLETTSATSLYENMQDEGGVGAGGSGAVVTLNEYPDLAYSPWFVGQLCKVTSTKDATPPAGVVENARIISIRKKDDSDKLILTFNKAVLANGAGAYTAIKCEPQGNPDSQTLKINSVEGVFHINASPDMEEANAPMVYSTMIAQEDSYPAATSANLNYLIPENTKNVYIAFNSHILSSDTHLDEYRITVDNKEIVNRPVKVESPLHYELINQVFMNNNKSVGSIKEIVQGLRNSATAGTAGRLGAANVDNVIHTLLMVPVPFKPVPQRLGVELTASGGNLGGSHIVFSECIKKM